MVLRTAVVSVVVEYAAVFWGPWRLLQQKYRGRSRRLVIAKLHQILCVYIYIHIYMRRDMMHHFVN